MTPKEFAETWFAKIDAKDYSGLKNMLAPNHKFNNPSTPEALNGEGHIGMIQGMMSAFTGSHRIQQLISEGDWVVVRGRWSGQHTGEFNGIPASGKPVDFSITDIMQVVDGKLVNEYMEWNAMTLMQQIGAMPQPA